MSLIIHQKDSSARTELARKIFERLQETPTPYESYTVAVTQARKKENEEKPRESNESKNVNSTQKMYTHHDPATERPVISTTPGVSEEVIDLRDEAYEKAHFSFADSQIMTKKELKRAKKTARQNVDISTELPPEGPSHAAKRARKDGKDSEGPSYTVNRIKTTVDASNVRGTGGPLGELSQEYEVQLVKSEGEEEAEKGNKTEDRKERRGRFRRTTIQA
ncbi:hypothetical protein COOONC_12874 [Cooperia oncophora]